MTYQFSDEEREAFFEQNFDYDDDSANNLIKANNVFLTSYCNVADLAVMISDGEVIDESTLILELSKLILSCQFRKDFLQADKKDITHTGDITSPYFEEAKNILVSL